MIAPVTFVIPLLMAPWSACSCSFWGPDLPVEIEASRNDRWPALASGRVDFGLAWVSIEGIVGPSEIRFVRLSPSGSTSSPVTTLVAPAGDAFGLALAWNGNHFGLVWQTSDRAVPQDDTWFVAFDETGAATSPVRHLNPPGTTSWEPKIAAATNGFAVVWNEEDASEDRLLLQVVDDQGIARFAATRIDSQSPVASTAAIAPSASGFGVAWQHLSSDIDLEFATFDSSGALVAGPVSVAPDPDRGVDSFLRIGSDGASYGLFWHESGPPLAERYRFVAFDPSANPVAAPVDVPGPADNDEVAGAVWNGNEYVLVWTGIGRMGYALVTADGTLACAPVIRHFAIPGYGAWDPTVAARQAVTALAWEGIPYGTSFVGFSEIGCDDSRHVLRASAKDRLPASPEREFAGVEFPFADPDGVLPGPPALLYYQVSNQTSPLYLLRTADSVAVHVGLAVP